MREVIFQRMEIFFKFYDFKTILRYLKINKWLQTNMFI